VGEWPLQSPDRPEWVQSRLELILYVAQVHLSITDLSSEIFLLCEHPRETNGAVSRSDLERKDVIETPDRRQAYRDSVAVISCSVL
jgi:hypothetical protein